MESFAASRASLAQRLVGRCAGITGRSGLGRQLLESVCPIVLAVKGRPLAVITRVFAIYSAPSISRQRAILSCIRAVCGCAPAVSGCAPHDLPARIVHRGTRTRCQLVITLGTRLIALVCRAIASAATSVAARGRAGTGADRLAAVAGVVVTCVAHEVM